jgi:hypothetical protein
MLLSLPVCGSSAAATPITYENTLRCRQFEVKAKTVVYKLRDMSDQSIDQSLRLIWLRDKYSRDSNLMQNRSRDRALGGLFGIDSIAYTWRCVQTNGDPDYLYQRP